MNPFDEFDAPKQTANPFDEFDNMTPQQRFFGPQNVVGNAISNMATDVKDWFVGKQDPQYANTQAYTGVKGDLQSMSDLARAKVVALDDARYGDIIQKQLGDKFIRRFKDANGFEIIEYAGPNGQPVQNYVNKPGVDWQDIDRVISGAIPFVAGGAVAGTALKGAGFAGSTLARVGGQSVGAVGGSVGADIAASRMGAKQDPATAGIDLTRASIAGLTGGLAEVVPPPVAGVLVGGAIGASSGDTVADAAVRGLTGATAGFAGGKVLSKATDVRPASPIERGRITQPSARKAAAQAGLDPDNMTAAELKYFGENVNRAGDMAEFGTMTRNNKVGIPTTKGQRTKDPELLMMEKDARYGNLGESAKRTLENFDKDQKQKIQQAALSRGMDAQDGLNPGVAEKLAPDSPVGDPALFNDKRFGGNVQEGLAKAKAADEGSIDAAWQGIERIFPRQEAFKDLSDAIDTQVGELMYDPARMPRAASMVETLRGFAAGKEAPLGVGLGEPAKRRMDMEFVRRRLKGGYSDAVKSGDPTEIAVSKAIYKGFDNWIDDLVEKGMIVGDPANVAKLRTAREITTEVKRMWEGAGRKTPGGKLVQKALEADTPERVISTILSDSGTQVTPKQGAREALRIIKQTLFKEREGFGKDDAARVWNDLRLAYWSKIAVTNKGEMNSPKILQNNLDAAFANQRSIMDELFDLDEIAIMNDLRRSLRDVNAPDPNASNSSVGYRAAMKKEGALMGTLKLAAQTQQKRELFSKGNVMMSRIYQMLAKNLPKRLGTTAEGLGERLARRAVSQKPQVKAPPFNAPMFTPAAPYMTQDN